MNTTIPQFIAITDLRIKTKEVFDLVKNKNLPVIVMRESVPEAVIIPFSEFNTLQEEKRRLWNKRIDELASETKPYIEKWLKKKGYNPQKVSGDRLIEILEEDDKSSR